MCSSHCKVWVSEHDSSKGKTSDTSPEERTSEPHGPVEVVVAPEVLEELALADDSLLLSSVDASTVADGQLQPGGGWVPVRDACFVETPVLVFKLVIFCLERKRVSAKPAQEFSIGLT